MKILLDDGIKKIYHFLDKHDIRHCAFYGCREPIKLWIQLLENKVSIDYIIEDRLPIYKGIKCIKINDRPFPETDAIFIMDIAAMEKIKKTLKCENVTIPFYDINEIV